MSTPFPREGYSGRGKPPRKPLDLNRPGDDIVRPGQVWYQFYGSAERDTFGRLSFFMYWHSFPLEDVCAGPQRGTTTRGQVFFTDDRERMREDLAEGKHVFLWPSGEEVTEVP